MRVGIIGTGWGRMHVGAFRAAGADVVAVCGRDEAKTRAIAARERIRFATTDIGALVAAVDAVVVASPDGAHAAHAATAIDAGRHVLCEKPLTRTAADAVELAARAARSPVVAAVCFPYRWLAPVVALRAWLAGRRATVEVLVRNGFPVGPDSGDLGGVSHIIDAALFLAADAPAWVQAHIDGPAVHMCVGGAAGSTLAIAHRPAAEPGIWGSWSLAGEGWEAGFSAGYRPERGGWVIEPARILDGRGWHDLAPAPPGGALEPWAQAHADQARAFVAGAVERLASFADGARVQLVLDAAMRSEREGRRVGLLPVAGADVTVGTR